MANFSTIIQSPDIRALVQQNMLERAFHDALFPRLLYRSEAAPQLWAANVGDTQLFTGKGLMPVNLNPLVPGQDPIPVSYSTEQWSATLNQYAGTIDTAMPTSIVAIANLFLTNAQQLGLQAGQSMNRITRDRMFNAAISGNTVTTAAVGPTSTLPVERLNGFTTARNPNLSGGSPVTFSPVSASNPLAITVFTGVATSVNVIGFTSATLGDEVGPGTLTLSAPVTVGARAYVISFDASAEQFVGGGNQTDAVGPTDILQIQDCLTAVSGLRQNNVPPHGDGHFHAHLDPIAESEIFADPAFQRLNTSIPDYYMYRDFAIGALLGAIFIRNTESPQPSTVFTGPGGVYSQNDPFAGDLFANGTTGTPLHYTLFTGQGGILEYYQDPSWLLTEAGVTGKVGEFQIDNNGIEVFTDRIQLVIRAPLNRLQDLVSTSWRFLGDWPVRTDASTGGTARYKRFTAIVSA